MQRVNNHTVSVIAFLILVIFFSTVSITAALLFNKTANLAAGFYMLFPALSAILVRFFIYEKKFSDASLHIGSWKNYLLAWFAGTGLSFLYGCGFYLTGSVDLEFTGTGFLSQMDSIAPGSSEQILSELPEGMTLQMMLLLYTLGGLTLFSIPGILLGFGEEFGWRGFLFPLLYRMHPAAAFLGGGLIWFVWHIPLTLLNPDSANEISLSAVPSFLLLAVSSFAMFILFAYAYVISKSIWLPSFFHIVVNNSSRAFSYWYSVKDQETANMVLSLITIAVVMLIGKKRLLQAFQDWAEENR